jgi:O-antigen ligase
MIGQFDLKENTKRSFVKFLFIGLIVYAIRFYMHITGIITRPIYSFNRYSGGYILSQMSLILASIFVFLFIFFLYGKLNKKDKFYTLIFILLTFSLVLITKTRGIYLAIVITIPLILLMRNLEHFFVTILLSSIFLVVLSFSFPNNKYLKRFKAITRADISTMGRIEVWNESFRIFKENIINGVGYMNFKKAEKTEQYKYNNKHYVHSHSMYFKMLAETGIIGTITYLLLFGGLLIRAIKRRKEFRYLAIFSIISVLMLYELTEVFIWRNFAHALIFFTLSVLLNTEYQNSENHIKLGYKKA